MLSPRQQMKKDIRQMVIGTIGLMLMIFFLVILAVPVH